MGGATMKTLHDHPPNPEPSTALLGLAAALTSATAFAQLLGDLDTCNQLLRVKRDVLARCREDRASFTPRGGGPSGLPINEIGSYVS